MLNTDLLRDWEKCLEDSQYVLTKQEKVLIEKDIELLKSHQVGNLKMLSKDEFRSIARRNSMMIDQVGIDITILRDKIDELDKKIRMCELGMSSIEKQLTTITREIGSLQDTYERRNKSVQKRIILRLFKGEVSRSKHYMSHKEYLKERRELEDRLIEVNKSSVIYESDLEQLSNLRKDCLTSIEKKNILLDRVTDDYRLNLSLLEAIERIERCYSKTTMSKC